MAPTARGPSFCSSMGQSRPVRAATDSSAPLVGLVSVAVPTPPKLPAPHLPAADARHHRCPAPGSAMAQPPARHSPVPMAAPEIEPNTETSGSKPRSLAAAFAAKRRAWADDKRALGTIGAILSWALRVRVRRLVRLHHAGRAAPARTDPYRGFHHRFGGFPRGVAPCSAPWMLGHVAYGPVVTYMGRGHVGNHPVAGSAMAFLLLALSPRVWPERPGGKSS